MRSASALALALLLALAGSALAAGDAKSATSEAPPVVASGVAPRTKVPLRVVKVMLETQQVLLFDKIRGTHVLAEVGKTVEGYTVDEIDEDEVTLRTGSGVEVVLVVPSAAPPPSAHATPKPTIREVDAQKPVDPYGETDAKDSKDSKASKAPVDPYAQDANDSKDTNAPVDPYGEPVRVVEAPTTTSAGGPAPVRVVEAPDAPAKNDAPAPAKTAPAPTKEPAAIVIARAELDAALSDFGKLANAARGAFTPNGLRVDSVLDGSLFAKAGVRGGDLIVSVDNVPLRSLDDAATLYARATTARNVTLQVLRAGKPLAVHIAIR